MHDDGVCRACGTRVLLCCYAWWDALMAPPGSVKITQLLDCTLWQVQNTALLYASAKGHNGAVRVLVDSKADIEARNKVAMWPVQPGVGH